MRPVWPSGPLLSGYPSGMSEHGLTYQSAGVNIDEAQRALRSVTDAIKSTYTPGVMSGVGGFGSLYALDSSRLQNPLLVTSIDGVGTKTRVAQMMGKYDNLGKDIVNHSINDILCQGAQPLYFLDYFGTSRLSAEVFEPILLSMADACLEAGIALVGGETAELPGVYSEDEFDVVGTIVGVVDAAHKLPRPKPQSGDALIGIMSNGLHTNGFSLARRALFEIGGLSVRDQVPGLSTSIGEELLKPHRSYFQSVYPLIEELPGLYALAHITGGGLYDNLPRVLPSDMKATIDRSTWSPQPIFQLIQECGNVPDVEMFRTFNMGIGMVVVVDQDMASAAVQRINEGGDSATIIGQLQSGSNDLQIV